jgi:putative serine protease PepD
MTETPEHPSTPEQPGRAADQEAELVPAAVLPQHGDAALAPENPAPQAAAPAPSAQSPAESPAPSAQSPAGQGWLQPPAADLAPPSLPSAPTPAQPQQPYPAAPPAYGQPQPPAQPQPQQPNPYLAQPPYAGQPQQAQQPQLYPQQQPQPFAAQQPAQPQQPGGPSSGEEPTSPSWASPALGGLPPYGEGPAPLGFEPTARNSKNRILLTAALVAALVGGGVGAGISYALRDDSGNAVTSSVDTNGLDTGSANATAVTAVAKKVLPSVVTITVAPTSANAQSSGGDIGTGIILSSTGEILTNNHVISTAASGGYSITVTFDGGANAQATIVDRDPTSDLAVIQAQNVKGLTPATLGESSTVQIGQEVVAIGAPLGMSNTVTSGIVSALNRPVIPQSDSGSSQSTPSTSVTALDAIQTDAAINPGNSGGPLINMNGEVIGIDSAIASTGSNQLGGSSESGSIGLGFAIPITQAKPVIQELEAKKTPTHAVLGVSVQDAATTASHTGAMLSQVNSGGAAANSGLKSGDEVIMIDNQQVDGSDALEAAVHSYRPGTTVKITYIRDGQTQTANVTLGSAVDSSS